MRRKKNRIEFGSRVDDRALKGFMVALEEALSRGHERIVLDFRLTTRAYADSMLPLICHTDARRARGSTFDVLLPDSTTLAQLFLNTNWAHLIDPKHPSSHAEHPRHLPVMRYREHAEQQFAVRAATDVVLRNMDQMTRDAIRAVEWTVNEITDNVLNHAQSEIGGLVQVDTFREQGRVKLVVADGGRGIPAAMREAYPHLHDQEAISKAMERGVTSPRDAGQGNGLAGSVSIARLAEGSFKILSGNAALSVFRDDRGGPYKTQKGEAPRGRKFPGTTVMLEMSTTAPFDLGEALALDGTTHMTDIVDLRYAAPNDTLVVKVCEESLGVGTRHAGAELRRKCTTLLGAEPTKRLILDWEGLAVVSSSFADEAIGKLFVDLGFTRFSSRVSHANAEPLVASLLDRAVMQRVAQSVNSHTTRGEQEPA